MRKYWKYANTTQRLLSRNTVNKFKNNPRCPIACAMVKDNYLRWTQQNVNKTHDVYDHSLQPAASKDKRNYPTNWFIRQYTTYT